LGFRDIVRNGADDDIFIFRSKRYALGKEGKFRMIIIDPVIIRRFNEKGLKGNVNSVG
jgi:hypothetical protein